MKKFVISKKMITVPVTIEFDQTKPVGWLEIDEEASKLLCDENLLVLLRQGFIPEPKELIEISLCRQGLHTREMYKREAYKEVIEEAENIVKAELALHLGSSSQLNDVSGWKLSYASEIADTKLELLDNLRTKFLT